MSCLSIVCFLYITISFLLLLLLFILFCFICFIIFFSFWLGSRPKLSPDLRSTFGPCLLICSCRPQQCKAQAITPKFAGQAHTPAGLHQAPRLCFFLPCLHLYGFSSMQHVASHLIPYSSHAIAQAPSSVQSPLTTALSSDLFSCSTVHPSCPACTLVALTTSPSHRHALVRPR